MDAKIQEFIDNLINNSAVFRKYLCPDIPLDLSSEDDSNADFLDSESIEDTLINEENVEGVNLESYINYNFDYYNGEYYTRLLLNGYWKPAFLDEYLESMFEEFKIAFTKNNCWNDIDIKRALTKQIKKSKAELEEILISSSEKIGRTINFLLKVKIEYCVEAIRFINNPLILISNQVEQKQAKLKKPIDNLTCLTQNQVVILFHYLRKQELVGRGMPDKMYAQYISELTGFSNEPIRKDLSNIKNVDSIEFIEANYSAVRRVLDLVTNKIKTESEERFS